MSTATAEVTEKTETLPPVGDAPTPKQKEAFLDIFRSGKKAAPKEAVVQDKVVTETGKQKEDAAVAKEVVKTDPPKEEKKAEVKDEKGKEAAQQSFAELRQKAEAAEKALKEAAEERDRLKTQYEELMKKPAPEEFLKKLEATEKEKAEYQKRLREADLSRDPEFNAQFDVPIRAAMEQMVEIAVRGGVDRKEAVAAVSAWDRGQFKEWLGVLDELDRGEFAAAVNQASTLYKQKEATLANAETEFQKLQKQREEAQKSQQEQYRSGLAADVEANLKELAETPLGKEHTELLTETRTLLRRAARLEGEPVEPKVLLGMVGKSLLMAKGFEKQQQLLEEKAAKIVELEKTLAERDAFIKERSGDTPPIGGSTPAKKQTGKEAAMAILNPRVA